MKIIDLLNWRYATKKMTGAKVPAEKISNILEAIRLAPTSIGLQPFTVFVVENELVRKQLTPAANNQPQIAECSHLLVFAAWQDITEAHMDNYMDLVGKTRGLSPEALVTMRSRLSVYLKPNPEHNFQWAARQAYIALGTAMVAAAAEGVDATPMEGFKPDEVDAVLGLKEKGLHSVLLLPLGFRDMEKDQLVKQAKVRRSAEELFVWVK